MIYRSLLIIISLLFFSVSQSIVFSNEAEPLKCVNGKHYVNSIYYGGRLGNQLFQIAAALSVAIDNDAEAIFPDYARWEQYGVRTNWKKIYPRINTQSPLCTASFYYREHNDFELNEIPYQPNMELRGYFQSEKYFVHNKDKILPYFEMSEEISNYLTKKYSALLAYPTTVAVHARAYVIEDVSYKNMFAILNLDYYEKAAALFPDQALFVIFADNVEWAKKLFKNFSRPHIFVEGEEYYNDFYLMSMLDHQIISNSSFSWWAAYLNTNFEKIVVAPSPWFHPTHHLSSDHIVPESWLTIPVEIE